MYEIKKVRRKMLINNEFKMITLYKCLCKFGTQNSQYMLLFDKPEKGIKTKGIKEGDRYTVYSLFIEIVREDNFVILYLQ